MIRIILLITSYLGQLQRVCVACTAQINQSFTGMAMQASAFSSAMASAVNPDCNCDLTATITTEAVETIIAEASAAAMATACVGAPPNASATGTPMGTGIRTASCDLLPVIFRNHLTRGW